MLIFDPEKDAANIAKHGVSLALADRLSIEAFREDSRHDYGERRIRAYGRIDGVAYCLVYVVRGGLVRPISLRRAHLKEYRRHVRPS